MTEQQDRKRSAMYLDGQNNSNITGMCYYSNRYVRYIATIDVYN